MAFIKEKENIKNQKISNFTISLGKTNDNRYIVKITPGFLMFKNKIRTLESSDIVYFRSEAEHYYKKYCKYAEKN